MAIYRVQLNWNPTSLNPLDAAVNTLHFDITGVFATEMPIIQTTLRNAFELFEGFYANTVISGVLNTFKVYALDDPEPRSSKFAGTMGAGFIPTGGNPLPSEVAVCLSFQAAQVSGTPQARRRGRIYLGPLGASGLDTNGRPTSACRSAASAVGASILADSVSNGGWSWVVWSPTTGTSSIVTNGWVDNAFDIQRRRGVAPTLRTTF